MKDDIKKAFDFAQDATKQLITLSTGIIALTITFGEGFAGSADKTDRIYALLAWGTFLLSVFFGLWTLLALTGTLEAKQSGVPVSIRGRNVTIPSGLQVLTFLIGLILTVVFGVKAL